MGKLSSLADALERAKPGASKVRAAERAWASNGARQGQLKGLSDYFEHNARTTAPPTNPDVIPAKPMPPVSNMGSSDRRMGSKPKLDLRRRADDAEALASGYRRYADEMDANPRQMQYFVDANKLKALNDNYGFSVGDRLIELQNKYLQDEISGLHPDVNAMMARGPGDEVFLAGNDDAIMREAIDRANNKLITEGVHMDLPDGGKRTISGVSSLKYGAGPTLDDAEADLMASKAGAPDDRADASEAIDVTEQPRVKDGSLGNIKKILNYAEGGPVEMSIGGALKKVSKKLAKNFVNPGQAITKVVAPKLNDKIMDSDPVNRLQSTAAVAGLGIKDAAKNIAHNPIRGVLGSVDPASTKIWNTILGRHDNALVNLYGSPTEDTFRHAAEEGIDTKGAKDFFKIGDSIAGYYGTAGLGAGLGNALGATAGKLAPTIVSVADQLAANQGVKEARALPGATADPVSDPSASGAGPAGQLDLVKQRANAIAANAAAPTELSRLQSSYGPRTSVMAPRTTGLLQQIQQQQAARQIA